VVDSEINENTMQYKGTENSAMIESLVGHTVRSTERISEKARLTSTQKTQSTATKASTNYLRHQIGN